MTPCTKQSFLWLQTWKQKKTIWKVKLKLEHMKSPRLYCVPFLFAFEFISDLFATWFSDIWWRNIGIIWDWILRKLSLKTNVVSHYLNLRCTKVLEKNTHGLFSIKSSIEDGSKYQSWGILSRINHVHHFWCNYCYWNVNEYGYITLTIGQILCYPNSLIG